MDAGIKKEIEEYAKLPASKQLTEFLDYHKKISPTGIDVEGSLLLLMKTKVSIFAKANNKGITDSFSEIIKTLNQLEEKNIKTFINSISEAEKEEIRKFLFDVLGAIVEFNRHYGKFGKNTFEDIYTIKATGDLLSAKIDTVEAIFQKVKAMFKNVDVTFQEYISNPGKSTYSKFIEGKKESFNDRANKYRSRGVFALIAAASFFSLLLLFGMFLTCSECFYNSYDDRMNYFALVSFIGGKILIATTLFFALISSVRVYFAFSHNETICRHREDVLNSYEAIHSKLMQEDKKSAIAKVTDAVFTQLPTGFSKLQSDEGKSNRGLEFLADLIINKAK